MAQHLQVDHQGKLLGFSEPNSTATTKGGMKALNQRAPSGVKVAHQAAPGPPFIPSHPWHAGSCWEGTHQKCSQLVLGGFREVPRGIGREELQLHLVQPLHQPSSFQGNLPHLREHQAETVGRVKRARRTKDDPRPQKTPPPRNSSATHRSASASQARSL